MLARHRSAVVFLATMVLGGSVLLSTAAQDGPLLSLSLLIAATSESALRALGVAVARSARTLFSPDRTFGMRVDNDCNGAWAHLIFLASVLAYPARWRDRLVGLALGEPLLFVLNIVRVMSLFVIGVHAPSLFRATHVYVWQFLIIGLALLLFVVWVDRFVREPG